MNNCYLSPSHYAVKPIQLLHAPLYSPYVTKHIDQYYIEKKIGHLILAIFEAIPVLGFVISLFEMASYFIAEKMHRSYKLNVGNVKVLQVSSQNGFVGIVDKKQSTEALTKLKSKLVTGVGVDEKNLVTFIRGGTCTIMASFFAKKLISCMNEQNPAFQTSQKVSQIAKEHLLKSNLQFRSQQAALDCLTKQNPAQDQAEFQANKAKVFLKFYGMEMEKSADHSIDLDEVCDTEFTQTIKGLDDGVYFLRLIKPLDTDQKGEYYGHSLCFVKLNGESYLYDPNTGVYEFHKEKPELSLLKTLDTINFHCRTSVAYFHKIKIEHATPTKE